ncbi:ABC transporter ATP-binding protein [Paenibacillus antri]|uniref:ABC transporter ATP-binding protein n=1 Tax=Paenibacillus antri TaxID=2582848 RepID=A0A5R9GE42_9BACL|nr:ABC transporter ATP-binding protein [Paenibacillus antri]TLS54041.1 ABC transporter ATP-binding protein [Paenibacillus antri]
MSRREALLEVRELKTYYSTETGVTRSVDGVSFKIERGEVLGVVGESGCGKSVMSYSVMGLVEEPGRIVGGEIIFEGTDLAKLSKGELKKLQGNAMSMIFQEPLTSLNPLLTIGYQISENIMLHQAAKKKTAKQRSIEMLRKVGIARPEAVFRSYPHELSGGMRQRAMIAIALSCNPKLLIADEPTTALDVTIQAQILRLMQELRDETQASIMIITHDLGVIAEMVDRVIVMYAGQVVEEGDVYELFRAPKHPYTLGLIRSTPRLEETRVELDSIPGTVPAPSRMPAGCRFHPRCAFAAKRCASEAPPLRELGSGTKARCWLHEEGEVNLVDERKPGDAVAGG